MNENGEALLRKQLPREQEMSVEPDRGSQMHIQTIDQPDPPAPPETIQLGLMAAIQHRMAVLCQAPAYRRPLRNPNFPSEPDAS